MNTIEPTIDSTELIDIGQHLQEQRQRHNQTAAQVASAVRLPVSTIEYIEANNFSAAGKPVYVRGYLVLYARHVGLDAPYLVEQYNLQYPEEGTAFVPAAGRLAGHKDSRIAIHGKLFSLAVSCGVVFLLLLGYFWVERLIFTPDAKPKIDTVAQTNTDTSNELNQTISRADAAENLADDVLSGQITDNTPILLPPNTVQPNTSATTAANDTLQLQLPVTVANTADTTATSSASDAVANSIAAAIDDDIAPAEPLITLISVIDPDTVENKEEDDSAENTASNTENTVQQTPTSNRLINIGDNLVIRASFNDDCWLRATDSEGRKILSGTYGKNDKIVIRGKAPLKVVFGNFSALTSTTLNGKAFDLQDYKTGKFTYRFPKSWR